MSRTGRLFQREGKPGGTNPFSRKPGNESVDTAVSPFARVLELQRTAGSFTGNAVLYRVGAGSLHIHGVIHPVACLYPANVQAALGTAFGLDAVHGSVIFGLDLARYGSCRNATQEAVLRAMI